MTPVIRHSSLVTAAAVAATLALAGCDYMPWGYTHVKDVVSAPAGFEGKEIRLKGRVRNAVSMLGVKAYTVREETGEITVVTDGTLPGEGEEVKLKGVVKTAAIVSGNLAVGLRVEETKRLR